MDPATDDVITTEAATPVQGSPPHVYLVAKMIFTIALAVFILCGNSMTIYAVIRTKALRRMPTNVYVINLAITDTLVGFFVICFQSVHASTSNEVVIRNSIYWARAPYYTTVIVSTCTLLAIALDRYIAIVHPLSYKSLVTVQRAIVVSVSIWIFELAVIGGITCYYGSVVPIGHILAGSMADLLPRPVFLFVVFSQICLPIAGNIVVYAAIFVSIHTRKKVSDSVNKRTPDKRATSVTKMMMLILGYLLFAWLPYFCIAPIYKYDQIKPMWYIYLNHATILLLYTNSAVNPIIYSWMNRDFREAYTRILKCATPAVMKESPDNTLRSVILD